MPWIGGGKGGHNVQDFGGWRGNASASNQQHSGREACQLDGLPVQEKKAYLSGENMSMQLFLKDNIEL